MTGERRKILAQVMDYDAICNLWSFAQGSLHLDIETEEGVTVLRLLAFAYVLGAHRGLAFPEITGQLLANSDEVWHLVKDCWEQVIQENPSYSQEDVEHLAQSAMERESVMPLTCFTRRDGYYLSTKRN